MILSSLFVEDVLYEICLSVRRREPCYPVTWCEALLQTTCPCRQRWHVLFLECESTTLTGLYFTMDSCTLCVIQCSAVVQRIAQYQSLTKCKQDYVLPLISGKRKKEKEYAVNIGI